MPRRENRPERLTKAEVLARRNEDKFSLLIHAELERHIQNANEQIAASQEVLERIPSLNLTGSLQWLRSIVKVCRYLQTTYKVSQRLSLEDMTSATNPDTERP